MRRRDLAVRIAACQKRRNSGSGRKIQSDPLADFFAAEAVPAVDRGFRTAVMERVARRRLHIELALRGVATLLLLLGVALVSPALQRLAKLLGEGLLAVTMIVLAASMIAWLGHVWLTRQPRLALPRLRLF